MSLTAFSDVLSLMLQHYFKNKAGTNSQCQIKMRAVSLPQMHQQPYFSELSNSAVLYVEI
jgi:hypothetical protein